MSPLWADFDNDERWRLMTRAQKGMYIMLLNHSWKNDGLPENPKMISKCIAEQYEDFRTDWLVVEPCFPISEDGRRRHPRQERERNKAIKKSKKRAIAGKKGAERRWQLPHDLSRQMPSETHGNSYEKGMANDVALPSAREWQLLSNGSEPDWLGLLDEMEGIYKQAGVPVSPQQRQLALQLIISLLEEEKQRVRERLPNFCKWALATGRWPSPAKTKSLVNVLRDGDWDVEVTPRTVPVMPEESAHRRMLNEQEERLLRRHHEWGKS